MVARPLKIAVSAGSLRGAGSGAVGRGILTALADARNDVEIEAWVPKEWSEGLFGNVVIHPVGAGHATKLWSENATLRTHVDARRFDALFSLGDTGTPYARVPHLLLVQQAYLAYSREAWCFSPTAPFARKMRAIEAYFRLGLRSVSRFTVQTEDMRTHLASRWDIDASVIDVVPSSILPLPSYARVRANRPYVVCVTSPGEHKNLDILPDIVAAMRDRTSTLWITVRPGDAPTVVARAAQLGVSSRLVFTGPVDRATALGMVAGAAAAVLPSHLESFGFAYYEALAVGCPVIASDRGFAREACGDAALYASPNDADGFAASVDAVLGNQALRDDLVHRGAIRTSALPTWSDVAVRYIGALERAVGANA